MSEAKYTEDDIQRLGGIIADNLADQFKKGFEAVETVAKQMNDLPEIKARIESMETDVIVTKAAAKDIGRDIKKLDLALGNVEHRVDKVYTFSVGTYSELRQENKALRLSVEEYEQRMSKLETSIA